MGGFQPLFEIFKYHFHLIANPSFNFPLLHAMDPRTLLLSLTCGLFVRQRFQRFQASIQLRKHRAGRHGQQVTMATPWRPGNPWATLSIPRAIFSGYTTNWPLDKMPHPQQPTLRHVAPPSYCPGMQ